jgi:hypothetical protein
MLFFVVGMAVVIWALFRNRISRADALPILLLVGYGWLFHIPMTIQSRYLVPLHIPVLILFSLSLAAVLDGRRRGVASAPSPSDRTAEPPLAA